MNTTYGKQILLLGVLILLSLCGVEAYAQPNRDFKTDPIKVVKSYQPIIKDAYKLSGTPSTDLNQADVKSAPVNYTSVIRNIPTNFTPETLTPIQPRLAIANQDSTQRRIFVRAGFGNYTTPVVDVHAQHALFKNKLQLKANANHQSSRGVVLDQKLDKYEHANLADSRFGLGAEYQLGVVAVYGDVSYENMQRSFYGFNQRDTSFSNSELAQAFNTFKSKFGITGTPKNPLGGAYDLETHYSIFQNRFEEQEQNYRIGGHFFAPLGAATSRVELFASYDYVNYQLEVDRLESKLKQQLFFLNPHYTTNGEKWGLEAGINTIYQKSNDSIKYHIYPHAQVHFNALKRTVVAFVGITGGLGRNTLETLSRQNPFLVKNLDLRVSPYTELYGGFKGIIGDYVQYLLRGNLQQQQNAVFFLNDSIDVRRMHPVYEPKAQIFGIHSEVQVKLNDIPLEGHVKINFRQYTLPILKNPWQEPTLSATVGARYTIQKGFWVGTDIFGYNGTKYKDKNATVQSIKGIVDINLSTEYKLKNGLSLFLWLNNITSARYLRWYSYPNYGINMVAGLTFSL